MGPPVAGHMGRGVIFSRPMKWERECDDDGLNGFLVRGNK